MGKRGVKPIPTRLKDLAGNPGRRPLNKKEPKPPKRNRVPTAPKHLDSIAKKEWSRISKLLFKMDLLTDIDVMALAAYCDAYSRWVDSSEKLRKTGLIIKAPSGYPVQNPLLSISDKAVMRMKGFLTEFGMTPSSRTALKVEPEPKEINVDQFLDGPTLVK